MDQKVVNSLACSCGSKEAGLIFITAENRYQCGDCIKKAYAALREYEAFGELDDTEDIHELILRLRARTASLSDFRLSMQPALRTFVVNKDFSLDERFHAWETCCDKIDHDRVGEGEVAPIGDWVEADLDRYQRGVDYDWGYFLDLANDPPTNPDEEIPTVTVDEFKEILIAENFGSMCFDW